MNYLYLSTFTACSVHLKLQPLERQEEIFSLSSILLYSSLFVFFFSILSLSLSCLVASCLLTRKSCQALKESKSSPWMQQQSWVTRLFIMRAWKVNLEVGESLPRQDLACPSRWISQENWCLLMSCQGHCYHRKLSLSSQGMWDICGRGSRLLEPGCPGAWLGASWWHLTRTADEVQGPAQPCCHLSVPLGQGKWSQNCFYSSALLLLVHADSA